MGKEDYKNEKKGHGFLCVPKELLFDNRYKQLTIEDQYEAAQIDGASKVQQFWYITVPHIKVVVGLLVVLRTIWVFNNFDIIYLLTGGGPANATTTMPIYAYNMGWNTKLLGRSSAVTMLLLAFLLLVCVIYFTIIGKWEKEDK